MKQPGKQVTQPNMASNAFLMNELVKQLKYSSRKRNIRDTTNVIEMQHVKQAELTSYDDFDSIRRLVTQ